MTVEGHIENGQVVLDSQVTLPDGARVRVQFLEAAPHEESPVAELPSLYVRLKPFVGSVQNLPPDYAINHDHYLHGQPKQCGPGETRHG